MKFNSLQFNKIDKQVVIKNYILEPLSSNLEYEELLKKYKSRFKLQNIKSFSFSFSGFFSLFFELNGKIAVSLGESEYIVSAAKKAKENGKDITFFGLNKDGSVNVEETEFDYVFISSYVMDTYFKTDLSSVKAKTKAKIISNATVKTDSHSDILVFDGYKLIGIGNTGVICFSDELSEANISEENFLALSLIFDRLEKKELNTNMKGKFLNVFKEVFNDDLFFFVDPKNTLEFTLHLGLKNIKMREIIRTLSLENIFLSNGEGCSLGLSKPSRIIQEMGYSQNESRWSLSLDFNEELNDETIQKIVNKIHKKYRQIKVLSGENI